MNKIIITLDGHSGCGKSTLAKKIAEELSYLYIDTGSMYRAVTLFFIRLDCIGLDGKLKDKAFGQLDRINVDFSFNEDVGERRVRLNGEFVEEEIRSLRVSNLVSEVSKHSDIRYKMVAIQQELGLKGNLVMDGRDIGTVVFPNAQIKFWVTASARKRAERRWLELSESGEDVLMRDVYNNIQSRDEQDANREVSPLKKPDNAIVIDNSDLNVEETFSLAMQYVKKALNNIS